MPFVPVSGSSDLTRFKRLSTRRREGYQHEKTVGHRTASSPELGARALEMPKPTYRTSPQPSPDYPPVTVAVHQFKGGTIDGSSRAVILQAPSALPPITSAYDVNLPPPLVPCAREDLPHFDFPTLKASDVERKDTSLLVPERQQLRRLSEEHEHHNEAFVGTFTTTSTISNGHTAKPTMTRTRINGYPGTCSNGNNNKAANIGAEGTKLPAPGKIPTVSAVTNGNGSGTPYAVQSGAASHRGSYLDPAQWTVVDEMRDHPGMRKNSGFFQPIKHLSGKP